MKDPAFLFYSNDFLSGTMLMSDEQIGKYIKLLCLQHQKGHLEEKDMLKICKTYDKDIFSKFKKDEQGNYYNERLEEEVTRRKKYSESRRNNRKKKDLKEEKEETYVEDMKNICNSYEEHMETETATATININNNNINNNNINNNNLNNNNLNNKYIKNKEEKEENLQKRFVECIGSTNLNAINECISYLNDLPIEVIEIALEKTSEANAGWRYAKKILNDWVKLKINTVEKVKTEDINFNNKKKPPEETEEEKIKRRTKELEDCINENR